MDTPVFTVHGKYTEEEYIRFYRYLAFRTKRTRWSYGLPLAIVVIWLICGIYGYLFLKMSAVHIILPIAVGAWYVWTLTGGLNRKAAKAYRSSKLSAGIEFDASFFEDHFESVDAYGNSSIPFDKLHAIYETPANFYLMTASSSGIMLQKENLPEGAQEFLRGVKEKYRL